MKKADIYEVGIKIVGFYSIFLLVNSMSEVLLTLGLILISESNEIGGSFNWIILIISFVKLSMIAFIAYVLIFKTKTIAKLFCSPIDYEENAKLFADRKVIYEISLVILGLLFVAWYLPDFIMKLIDHFKAENDMDFAPPRKSDTTLFIIATLRLSIGILSLLFSKQIANFFTSIQSKESNNSEIK